MPTECSAKPMGFARVDGRAVVADFEGGAITSNAGGLLLGATDRAIGLVERFAACFTDGRSAERVLHRGGDAGRAAGVRHRARPRGRDRPRPAPPRSGTRGGARPARGAAREVRAARGQEHAEPARARRRGHADRYHRIAHDGAAIEALFVDLFLDAHRHAAERDRARPRRHRRPDPRPAGGAVLPRLLRLLLLPAALRLLRPPPAGGEAARARTSTPRRAPSRRSRRIVGQIRAPLAAGADHPARRLGASHARR